MESLSDLIFKKRILILKKDMVKKDTLSSVLNELEERRLGENCKLILVSAPAANSYYKGLGFTNNPRCWILEPQSST